MVTHMDPHEVGIMFCPLVLVVLCAGSGCTMDQVHTPARSDLPATPPPNSLLQARTKMPAPPMTGTSLGLAHEAPSGGGYNAMGYDAVDFGPVGKRIIAERRPEDMAALKRALEFTDGPRTVSVDMPFPLRTCDYAALIAEALLYGKRAAVYSFGPYTAYEYRDNARKRALRKLFGRQAVLPQTLEYTYLDALGRDISVEVRQSHRPGAP